MDSDTEDVINAYNELTPENKKNAKRDLLLMVAVQKNTLGGIEQPAEDRKTA